MQQLNNIQINFQLKYLTKYNQSILGAYSNLLVEVDTLHNITFQQQLAQDPIVIKYLKNSSKCGLYVCDGLSMWIHGHNRILNFHQNSTFTKEFCCSDSKFYYSKFHHKYHKYSLDELDLDNRQIKILKLFELKPFNIIFDKKQSLIFNMAANIVQFNLQKVKVQILHKDSFLLSDNNNYYKVVGKQITGFEYDDKKKKIIDIQSIDIPSKIQTFGNQIIISSKKGIQFYDRRKINRVMYMQQLMNVHEFLYEPNIHRMYVSHGNNFSIFKTF